MTRTGLIITNAHAAVSGEGCPGNDLIIAIGSEADAPPIPTYRAQIVQSDDGLDLALVQIDRQIDGRLIDPTSLSLPFVELADSDELQLDETLVVFGYPDIGNSGVQTTRTTLTGFGAEPSGGDRAWIKTSISLEGAMTGGGAYNQVGQLVGVPATAPVLGISPETRCLSLQDTNQDSVINSQDRCVPVGGSTNVLRPSRFARPLFRAASLRLELQFQAVQTPSRTSVSGEPTFSRLFFSPTVNEAGMPASVVRTLPAGTESVYLFFNYTNMTPETVYELRVSNGGVVNATFSLPPVRWSGGINGLWYLGSSGQSWSNGIYDFTLLIDGVVADSARLLIGGGTEAQPTFSDIAFGIENTSGGVVGVGYVLPTGTIASARFVFRGMTPGLRWASIWYYEGTEVLRETLDWSDGESGTKTIRIQDPAGLLPGSYRLELYLDTGQGFRLASTSDFTLAGDPVGDFARIFENTRFTTAANLEDARTAPPLTSFGAGTETIYAFFNWNRIRPGTLWTLRWMVDGEPFYEQTAPWSTAENGENFLMQLSSPGGLPDGTYGIELVINRLVFARANARIGIGQLPIDRLAQASGVQMRGQVLDMETGAGVSGATVIVISELFNVEDFTERWEQEQVFSLTTTDLEGHFILGRLLQPSAPYSVFIIADGYLPVSADGLEVAADTPPLNIPVFLTPG
ncbi:MAG: trypsin-like peptidase domain-containing protein [Anaerolineae bacterium]|nr:trypsin-like peptidase domain-containing protein [Anaerolineae bacterium]NUQ02465.1 trypsin-like peptidase domain-containing protein [Anaerolineae bacterium]